MSLPAAPAPSWARVWGGPLAKPFPLTQNFPAFLLLLPGAATAPGPSWGPCCPLGDVAARATLHLSFPALVAAFGTTSGRCHGPKCQSTSPSPSPRGLRSSRSGSGSGKTGTEQGGRSGKLCRVPGAGPGGSGDVPVPGWDAPGGKCRLCYSHGKSGNTGPKRPSETSLGSAGVTSTSWGPQGAAGAGTGERPAGKREFRLQWDGGEGQGFRVTAEQEQPGRAVRDGNPGWC